MIDSFSKYIIEYIRKDFESNLVVLSVDSSDYLLEVIKEVFEVFLADVLSKYPSFNSTELKEDLIILVQSDCTLIACLMYRIERAIFLKNPSSKLLSNLANLMRTRTGIELYYSTDIGPGLNIQHGVGIVIGPRYTIGRNFIIHQGVTLGQRKGPDETITIGDNVIVYAGAKILGNIIIGNNVKIAANAVLVQNAAANSTYGGIPARKLN